jgi:hypothetical protein
MKTLEWNPAFGPIVTSLIILSAGFFFYFLRTHLAPRHGRLNAWLLLLPKMLIVFLIIMALLDPDLRLSGWNSTPARVLILQDISSSMDLRDDGSATRSERVAGLIRQLESSAPSSIHFEVLPFDTSLHDASYQPKDNSTRGTDLGAMFLALGSQPNLADADGAIVITDGGDETVDLPDLPSVPLAIVGVGTPPDTWDDIGVTAVAAPASVEESSISRPTSSRAAARTTISPPSRSRSTRATTKTGPRSSRKPSTSRRCTPRWFFTCRSTAPARNAIVCGSRNCPAN